MSDWADEAAERPSARGRRFAVAAARFNREVTSRLVAGALEAFRESGVPADDVELLWVPGAFELPVVTKRLAESESYDAVVCLGAVIRGETPHFDFVAGEAASGIQRVALDTGVPCIFGVLTTETVEQAMDRAGGARGNKGREAALAAIDTAAALDAVPKKEA